MRQGCGTRDFMAAPAKLLVVPDAFLDELFAKHANERNSLHRTIQGLLNDALQFSSFLLVVTDEPLNQFSVTIKNERLRNVLIVFQIGVRQFVIGKTERILNLKLLRKTGDLFAIVVSPNVETNDLKSLWFILALHLDQMRGLVAAGLAPGRIEIEHHNLPQIIRKSHALTLLKRPAVGARFVLWRRG